MTVALDDAMAMSPRGLFGRSWVLGYIAVSGFSVVFSTLTKVMLASLALSVAIKYGGPYLPLSGTAATAVVMVLSPSLILAIALGWDARHRQSPPNA
jgi:hypothetical protein